MPTRIYALAKDLKIDSKDLVDICTRAGIPGKGSALASLDDAEMVKLKAYMEGSSAKKAAATAQPLVNTRDVLSTPVAGTQTLPPPPRPVRAKPSPADSAPVTAVPAVEVAETTPAAEAPAAPVVAPTAPVEHVVAPVAKVETPVVEPVAPAVVAPVAEKPVAPPAVSPPVAKEKSKPAAPSAPAVQAPSAPAVQPPATPAPVGGTAAGNVAAGPAPVAPAADAGAKDRASSSIGKVPGGRPVPGSRTGGSGPLSPIRRDGLMPARSGGMRVFDTRAGTGSKRPEEAAGGGKGGDAPAAPRQPSERRAAVIRVANMPEVKQPTSAPRPTGPAAQRPIIRLGADMLKTPGGRPQLPPIPGFNEPMPGKGGAGSRGGKPGTAAPADAAARPGSKRTPKELKDDSDRELAGMAGVRAERGKRNRNTRIGPDGEEIAIPSRRRTSLSRMKGHGSTAAPRKGNVSLSLPCTVRSFCEATGVGANQVLKVLMGMGVMVTINAPIPDEMVELIAAELQIDVDFKAAESLEEQLNLEFNDDENDENLVPRPPIVTFLGHVDHGKTSLLDRIIGTNVVAGEAGGITQHIRAYSINTKDGRRVAFVDTPGHEAFTEMRARGANVTDIAVLVVAADDGMMPQTEEALSHAKAAEVPIVVAMNKIDLPGADEQRVLQQLATAGLLPSEWGGDVEVVRTSAITGQGMDTLLETLLVTAELHEYKANPKRAASGMCLEAEQEPGRGVIAKFMVQNGTLKDGDIVVCGAAHGRVKAMYDTLRPRQKVKTAGPSMPVNITGLDVAPNAGDKFYVLNDIARAREIVAKRATQTRNQSLGGITTKISFEDFQQRLTEGRLNQTAEVSVLNLIIRADVRGSIEAILKELSKFDHPEVKLKVLQASVGGVSVADVMLAQASGAVILGFNVIPDEAARALADERGVQIRRYEIIYKVSDDIKAMLEGKLKPEERVIELGRALVKQVFTISRVGAVAGSQIIQGSIERGCRIRVNRENRTIGDYALDSLRRDKDDVKEVSRGMECGIKLVNFSDVKEGDILEAYKIEEVARTL